jgi:hypothetical protein
MNFFIVLLTLLILLTCISNVCIYYLVSKPTGKRGEKGPKGVLGSKGPIGDIGPSGFTGEDGDKGANGPIQGLFGKKGIHGNIGPRGQPGEDGYEGLRGYTGKKGFPGLQGRQGTAGKKGRIGYKGPPRIFSSNDDIQLMAYKDKCITIKDPDNFKCPPNMCVFDFKGSKISNYKDDMKIENITCCKLGLYNPTLDAVYSRTEILTFLGAKIPELHNKYSIMIITEEDGDTKDDENKEKKITEEDRKKILDKLDIIKRVLSHTNLVNNELLYPVRLLFQLRNDEKRFMEEVKKFPKNNIIELENYLKIE